MGTAIRQKAFNLAQNTQKPYRYHFMQLLRLLEEGDALENYQLLSHQQLGFPATDVLCFNETDKKIVLSFMGLFGVDAPLPAYFIGEALPSNESAESLRAFLNIFNHRLYRLLYSAWKMAQPAILLEQGNKVYLHCLMALSGGVLSIHDRREFYAAGLLGRRVRSADGLQIMLEQFLVLDVSIQQFVQRWVTYHANHLLGKEFRLGDNILGQRLLDLSSEIRINVGPMSLSRALTLLPTQTEGQRLNHLIQRYLEPYIKYKLCLTIMPDTTSTQTLGASLCYMGYQSWIGELAQNVSVSIYC